MACVAAGWFYTGGPRPYGYVGLGEAFVFVFFGLVATVGTAYVRRERITGLAVAAAVPIGLLAVALLVVNNLRDIPSDTRSGKRTLAVRLGSRATRYLYAGTVWFRSGWRSPSRCRVRGPCWPSGPPAGRTAGPPGIGGEEGPGLIKVLGATGRLQLVFGALLAMGSRSNPRARRTARPAPGIFRLLQVARMPGPLDDRQLGVGPNRLGRAARGRDRPC